MIIFSMESEMVILSFTFLNSINPNSRNRATLRYREVSKLTDNFKLLYLKI